MEIWAVIVLGETIGSSRSDPKCWKTQGRMWVCNRFQLWCSCDETCQKLTWVRKGWRWVRWKRTAKTDTEGAKNLNQWGMRFVTNPLVCHCHPSSYCGHCHPAIAGKQHLSLGWSQACNGQVLHSMDKQMFHGAPSVTNFNLHHSISLNLYKQYESDAIPPYTFFFSK